MSRVWISLVSLWLGMQAAAIGQEIDREIVKVESSRSDAEGQKATIDVVQEAMTGTPKAVLLVMPSVGAPGNASAGLPHNRHEPAHYPLSRNREPLLQSGLAIAWMGWPSQAQFGQEGTASYDMQEDVSSVIKQVRQRWPKVPLILAGTLDGARTALTFVLKRREQVDGMLALSPHWPRERNARVESLQGLKTLVLHDTSGDCLFSPRLEVEEIAQRAGFSRIPVNVDSVGRIGTCGEKSAHWLGQADGQLAEVVSKWLNGTALPDHLGADVPVMTTVERVVFVDGPSGKMEVTLYLPPGKGPFPVFMFNHGDVDIEMPWVRHGERMREPVLGSVFLIWGFAVVVPGRPGVGRSEGTYRNQYGINDGDPAYKARNHSKAVLAAIEGLKGEPSLNLDQVLLAGQSAGGDTVMFVNTLQLPGVRGIVNFSGGRANHAWNETAKFENDLMIEGWAELGKKASAPVLLVFAENDSRFTANTIRKSTQAYKDSGGKAELLLLPPQPVDGHFVYYNVKAWVSAMGRFIAGLKMGNRPNVPPQRPAPDSNTSLAATYDSRPASAASAATLATEKTHPELFDLSRLAGVGEVCLGYYQKFLQKAPPRYFAVGSEKKGCGYSVGKNASEAKAIEFCQKYIPQCVLYARNNELVKPVSVAGAPRP